MIAMQEFSKVNAKQASDIARFTDYWYFKPLVEWIRSQYGETYPEIGEGDDIRLDVSRPPDSWFYMY